MADSEPWEVQEPRLPAYAAPSVKSKVLAEYPAGTKVRGTVVELNGHTWLEVEDLRGPRFLRYDGEELKLVPSEEQSLAIMDLDDSRKDLTLEECVRLQHGLIRRYMSADFQSALWGTYHKIGWGESLKELAWLRARRVLLQQEQFPLIETFGFQPTPEGVMEMSRAFTQQIKSYPKIAENRLLIYYLIDPGMQMDVAAGRVPPPRGSLWSRWKRPVPEEWTSTSNCKAWLVVGGAEKGGILVRTGPETSAPICRSRLEPDSLVEELERYENRIKYALMDGSGPEIGWVSVTYAFKPLLTPAFSDIPQPEVAEEKEYFRVNYKRVAQRVDPDLKSSVVGLKLRNDIVKGVVIKVGDEEWLQVRGRLGLCFMLIDGSASGLPALMRRLTEAEKDQHQKKIQRKRSALTLEEILKMHECLIGGYMSEEFQRAIWQAYQSHGDVGQVDYSELDWAESKARVCSEVQYPILKEFGFEESYKGVFKSIKAVPAELRSKPKIVENRLLMRYLVDPRFQLDIMEGWSAAAPRGVPRARVKNPNPDDWPEGGGKVWIVVGGEDKAGITVRKQESTQSPVLGARLSTDSMVEQLERVQNRIKYLLLRGSGPEIGWVSITSKGKLLLAPAHASLTSRDAKAIEEWVVVHTRVAQRSEPSTDGLLVGALKQGEKVKGVVVEKDLVQWLEVLGSDGLSYLMIDGASIGLGMLLQKASQTDIVLYTEPKESKAKESKPKESKPKMSIESQEVQVKLSLDDTIRMLNSLISGYMMEGFQRRIWQEYFDSGGDPDTELQWLQAKSAACQSVLFPVLEEFGFEASSSGMRASKLAITHELREVPEVKDRIYLREYLTDPAMQKEVAMERKPAPRGMPRSRVFQPFPDDWGEGTGKVWLVVGGAEAGGISVRKYAGLDSPLMMGKLASNSLIEELEREGSRIKYWRMDGSGPDYGWVSLTVDAKVLLEPYLGTGGTGASTVKVWTVVEKFVRERAEPSVHSDRVGLQVNGAKLQGVVVEKDGLQWLELAGRRKRYILIDGTPLGHGVLLKPAEAAALAIADDLDPVDEPEL